MASGLAEITLAPLFSCLVFAWGMLCETPHCGAKCKPMVQREMQIVRTEVVNGTSGNGMPATRVTFRGEDGESVVVEMRGKAGSDDAGR